MSGDDNHFLASIGAPVRDKPELELNIGRYVACVHDNNWWIGTILNTSSEDEEVKFMHPKGPSVSFKWPRRDDICWVANQHVLCNVAGPSANRRAYVYQLEQCTTKSISQKFSDFLKHHTLS